MVKGLTAAQIYSKQFDRVAKRDMDDLLAHEATEYDRGAQAGTRYQPAYMQGDYFEELKIESEHKRQMREYIERGGRLR